MDNPDPQAQEIAGIMISSLSDEEQPAFIERILSDLNLDINVQQSAARRIKHMRGPEKLRFRGLLSGIIRRGLDDQDITQQKKAAMILGLEQDQDLEWVEQGEFREIVSAEIEQGLDNPDIKIQKVAAEMILYAPKETQSKLRAMVSSKIRHGLDNSDAEVQKIAIAMIDFAPRSEQDSILEKIIEKGLGEELIKPPLYNGSPAEGDKFSRREFPKSGSKTTLIEGSLKGKTIVRQIEPEAFLAWQELYENYQLWQDNGFDYVPIEPIQSYRLNEAGLVDVFTGVLDLSPDQWRRKTKRFRAEIDMQETRITTLLNQSTEVYHGHISHNFCLRFFRDEQGNPDFTRVPRVYLIDFDQASYMHTKT